MEGYYPWSPVFIQRERIILRYDIDRYIRLGMLRDTAYDRGLANRSGWRGLGLRGADGSGQSLLGSWSHGCCVPTNRAWQVAMRMVKSCDRSCDLGVMTGGDRELVVSLGNGVMSLYKFVIGVFPLGYLSVGECKQNGDRAQQESTPPAIGKKAHSIRAREFREQTYCFDALRTWLWRPRFRVCLCERVSSSPVVLRPPLARPWSPWHFIPTRRCEPPGSQWRWYGMWAWETCTKRRI